MSAGLQRELACAALLGLALLAACDPSRPQGAYMPSKGYDPADHGFGGGSDGSVPEPPGEDDAGPVPEPPGADGGADVPPDTGTPEGPLAALAGRYLMRIDVYSTLSSPPTLGEVLTLKSRVSNLMVATLTVKDDHTLAAHETLCTQSYDHECVSNCQGWTTEVDPDLHKRCMTRVADRDYDVQANGALTAPVSTIPIGFDEVDGMPDLPTSQDDARVWNFGNGRYGVNTHITSKIGPLDATTLDCVVSTVQRYTTSFGGTLDLSDPDALTRKPMLVEASASTGETIYVAGTPDTYCAKSVLDQTSQQTPDEITVVRFARYEGASCPYEAGKSWEAAYEDAFPGVAGRPTPGQLM